MHPFTQKVADTIQKYHLLEKGDRVYVALSGGADSVTLLQTLLELRSYFELADIQALHVHHGLRKEAADQDEHFVRKLCDELHVPLTVTHVNARQHALHYHQTIEEAGRNLRYAFFDEITATVEHAKIATAHTLDDTVETVLFNLTRGCGLRGAGGIPVSRGRIIRPLLTCTATEIRNRCETQNWQYRIDETNTDTCFTRNRIRHEVLPLLENIHPDATHNIFRFSQLASEEDAYLNTQALTVLDACKSTYGYSVNALQSYPLVILRRALIHAVSDVDEFCSLEKRHIDELLRIITEGGTVNLPRGIRAICRGEQLYFTSSHTSTAQPSSIRVLLNETVMYDNSHFRPQLISKKEFDEISKIHKKLFNYCVSYDMIGKDVYLRPRKEGDAFHPSGRHCGKTLKKWFQEAAIPPHERNHIPILCDENGILALLGYAVDERAAVQRNSETILWFQKYNR